MTCTPDINASPRALKSIIQFIPPPKAFHPQPPQIRYLLFLVHVIVHPVSRVSLTYIPRASEVELYLSLSKFLIPPSRFSHVPIVYVLLPPSHPSSSAAVLKTHASLSIRVQVAPCFLTCNVITYSVPSLLRARGDSQADFNYCMRIITSLVQDRPN
jgi:hypothetical protein